VAAGPLDRDRFERRRVDLLAAVEAEGQLGRRLTQDVLLVELKIFTAVGGDADQLRSQIAGEQFSPLERLMTEPTLHHRGCLIPSLAKSSPCCSTRHGPVTLRE